MPTNSNFMFSVLVDGIALPEYHKDGAVYVESNLWTPVSYKQRVAELVYGEIEEQEWPVTPYRVRISTKSCCPLSWFCIYIDGTRVDREVLSGNAEWTCQGFTDSDGIKEFLFALPRFSRDENDRVASDRKSKIGTIEVVQLAASFLRTELRDFRKQDTEFDQANKKDAHDVTKGMHTMSTTKKGKIVEALPTNSSVSIYSFGHEISRLTVHYHMAHTLQDMGITVQQVVWRQPQNATSAAKQERQ